MSPTLLAIEAARIYDAEVAAIVGVFARHSYNWKVLSNDPAWPDSTWPSETAITRIVQEYSPTIIHFALHGVEQGLILQIHDGLEPRTAESNSNILTWERIEALDLWRDRIIVTGACSSLGHANQFLRAGAIAVVAPSEDIDWTSLCHFFRLFYSQLLDGAALVSAQNYADGFYGEFSSMSVRGNGSWTRYDLKESGQRR